MVKRSADAWPSPFSWLPRAGDDDAQLRLMILERSRLDVGILETPDASNRGPEIDRYLRRASVPESLITAGKGFWCAAWVGCMWSDAGAAVPRDFGSCDAWLPYMRPASTATLAIVGRPGDAVLYGKRRADGTLDAVHVGILWRLAPVVLSIEGNRGLTGAPTNNGVAVDVHSVTRGDVLGVVRPARAA